ncbi:hypothetical protein KVR01_012238 [Diaporthe batatas]|uniref:uncharacterized protein n=1 Tax=Diaporthe batatas TaxID=748121 RepID=UPI001D04C583|nr:uncharacterized protein KVR01_012238 [Diaporthe batatas]KAG8157966.1 hypothetical protein KVR01_012238 [Diaporthe batatas]
MDPSKDCLVQIRQLLDSIEKDNLSRDDSNPVGRTQLEQAAAPMQHHSVSSGGFKNPQNAEGCAITLKSLPGRGIGVVATRLIPAGSIILQEDATLTVAMPQPITLAEVRKQVLGLHACDCPDLKANVLSLLATGSGQPQLTEQQVELIAHLSSVFMTNIFDNTFAEASSLYLQASRFNHSCLPNCDYEHTTDSDKRRITIAIRTSRDIQPEEELCLTYLNYYEERGRRLAALKQNWGFVCNCPACDVENPAVDTAAHEKMLAEYRQLKKDPESHALYSGAPTRLWLGELEEVLDRSIRRSQIAEVFGDSYTWTINHIVSSIACKQMWLWTGNPEDFKSHVRFLEQGQLPAERMAPSRQGRALKARLEKDLSEAQKLRGTR